MTCVQDITLSKKGNKLYILFTYNIEIFERRYECVSCPQDCKRNWTALELINYSCPEFIHAQYDIISTKRCAVSRGVMTLITSDAITGKTFEEIGRTIGNFRMNCYLQKRCEYVSATHRFGASTSHEQFSSIDDPAGYNDSLQPSTEFIIEFFIGMRHYLSILMNRQTNA